MSALLDKVRARLFGAPAIQQTGVADEVSQAGTAFATLIEGVGQAIAKTQTELDATAGQIATDMAKTEVEIVQATVSHYGEFGNLENVKVVTGKASALSIAVPPALSFQRVHLEGSFVATEFSATSTSNVNINLAGAGISSKGAGMRGPSISASVANVNVNTATEQTQDTSVGSMSMTAVIRPKPVTAIEKPPLIFKGPSLKLTALGNATTVLVPLPVNPSDPPYLESRSAILKVGLFKQDNTPLTNAEKNIAVDCGSLNWAVTNNTGADVGTGTTTNASTGEFFIKVTRNATSPTEPKKDFVVRASLNLINATLNVSL